MLCDITDIPDVCNYCLLCTLVDGAAEQLANTQPLIRFVTTLSPISHNSQNLCVDEKRGGKAANQQHSRTGGRRAGADTGSRACYAAEIISGAFEGGQSRASSRGSIGSIERPRHREGGRSMREAFPSLPYGSPVLDREISKINSNNISSNTGPSASSGTPRCHSTSPHPPNRGPVEREGETTTTPPSLGTTTTSGGGSCSASVATSPVPSHHHLNIIKEGVQTLERDNFLSNISSAESASIDGEYSTGMAG